MKKSLLSFSIGLIVLTSTAFSQTRSLSFHVTITADVPPGEVVCVYLLEREGMGQQVVFPLTEESGSSWSATLDFESSWLAIGVTYHYKYCRNYMYNGADEAVNGQDQGYREVTIQSDNTVLQDTVSEWRWWPVNGQIPQIDTSDYVHTRPENLPDTSFQCGVELPDYWDHYFIYSLEPTLARIQTVTKANYVEYNPVPEITQFAPTPIINSDGVNGTSDSDLIRIVTAIKARGLKLYLDPFPWGMIQDPSPGNHSDTWWREFEEQWRPIVLHYAQIAQDSQVDMLTFNMWPNRWTVSAQEAPIVDSLSQDLFADVRAIYTGKIAVEFTPWGPDLQVYSLGDYLKFNISAFWPYQLSNSTNPTVEEMTANLNTRLEELYQEGPEKWNKPIILSQIAASSYNGTVLNQPDWQTQLYYSPNDSDVAVDFQEQADAYESFLEAFTSKNWIAGVYSFNYNYWNSLDKAPSIRSKPAELVVAKWYHWIHPQSPSGTEEPGAMPKQFQLTQNYPNPFNPTTTIGYILPEDNPVNLTIYNMKGQEVWRYSQTLQNAGWHQIQWDGQSSSGQPVSTGVYFYRIQAGNHVDVKKMVLMK